MRVPQELRQIKADLGQYRAYIGDAHGRLEYFRTNNPRFDGFADQFHEIDTEIRTVQTVLGDVGQCFSKLIVDIEQTAVYTKDFDLYPGDRVRITMPAQHPFPAGWAEGAIINANFHAMEGWYIEFEKDNVSLGWYTGYGYWKQDVDGGTVEKL